MPTTQEVAVVILRDDDGHYFLHQRRADKTLFPSLWGVGAGGKIEIDESSYNAALRELWEEAGCVPHIQHCFDMDYQDQYVESTIRVYEAMVNREDVGFDESEWESSRWCSENELRELASATGTLCPDTIAFVQKYLGMVTADSPAVHS